MSGVGGKLPESKTTKNKNVPKVVKLYFIIYTQKLLQHLTLEVNLLELERRKIRNGAQGHRGILSTEYFRSLL